MLCDQAVPESNGSFRAPSPLAWRSQPTLAMRACWCVLCQGYQKTLTIVTTPELHLKKQEVSFSLR